MKSLKYLLTFALVAGVISFGIAGCGGDEEATEIEQPETEQVQPDEPTEPEAERARQEPTEEIETEPAEEESAAEPEQEPDQEDSDQPEEEQAAQDEPLKVRLATTKGEIVIELYQEDAPITVANFMSYVLDGDYDGTIFHRVIPGFMIQGGGLTPTMERAPMNASIKNEAGSNLANQRGTVAMARKTDPDSATNQFFINLTDNPHLNYGGPGQPGYAVFGKVVEGMDVVQEIAQVQTETVGEFQNVPADPVIIEKAEVATDTQVDAERF
ncbi:Peptidyl-prolyl cis-trans isomerase A precursor [Anaerohalosphaera lusitana]|uniref:Peptidyl-prolyl cis-trans isomerase n=1 Tax=Anaerohalosphaera lusitana TaxID=1936003 RepID=A0A1U9NNJ5_9BACT|nr:peptidylprolyl isomerase [Anaerohalosphaera lusitana]AQT69405.1 Peptidyl-prolyl cis-trans isomerase A precursor [Anaerohalosphaera lusitana]